MENVAPRTGAWIETRNSSGKEGAWSASPLAQGRGLKRWQEELAILLLLSPLAQGRGLKQTIHSETGIVYKSPLAQGRGLKLINHHS